VPVLVEELADVAVRDSRRLAQCPVWVDQVSDPLGGLPLDLGR